jgi:hypothetical protein
LIQETRIYTVLGWIIQQFSRYKKCPLLSSHWNPRDDDFNKLAFVLRLKTFICKFELYGPIGSWEDLLNMFPLWAHVKKGKKKVSPIVAPHDPRGPWFQQTLSCTMSESFHVNFSSFRPEVLEKTIFKIFFPM